MYQIVLYMGLLLLLGLIVMYALGPQRANVMNYAYGTNYSDTYFFGKQLTSVFIAIVAFSVFYFTPYKWITGERSKYILYAGFALCILLFLSGAVLHLSFAQETNGAYRWFQLGVLGSFQPSELLKYGVLLFLAGFLGRRSQQGKLNDIQETIIPLGIISGLSLLMIVFLQKDLGTGISLIAIILSMILVAGIDWKIFKKILAIVALCGLVMIFTSPHRIERVMTFVQGDSHKGTSSQENKNYHIQQARIAIGSGGLLGLGIGKSVQATGYLPEATNDSIFAVMGETFGFIGLMAILALFTALPVATTANANNGTINQPIFTSPTNGTWKLATPSLAKKNQPRTTPINVISANFTGLRSPAAPPPKPRRLMISSISPTIPPPTNAARGSQV
jgi:cell division protein FtsW